MSLTAGDRVGVYEIVALIGSGGMGEVYRARDTRLKREVAIKVLPDAFASDPDRLARFQREAELLATLNHPNIAQIHGLEERALVLELVEGPTLADRIAKGPLPLDEALLIARQIADALEAAHERGVIHRDLKPANGTKFQISKNNGHDAMWSPNGRQIVYDVRAGYSEVVDVSFQPSFAVGMPASLPRATMIFAGGNVVRPVDTAPDGRIVGPVDAGATPSTVAAARHILIVQNWHEELKRLVPVK